MNLYVIAPSSDTHMAWVNSQPLPANPYDRDSPTIPVPIADGVMATWTAPLQKSHGYTHTLEFVLTLGRDLDVSILAGLIVEWVVSNFKGRAEKVVIERTEVSFDRSELLRVVTETIRYERE